MTLLLLNMKNVALKDPASCTFQELCDQVVAKECSLSDVFDIIQAAAYADCDKRGVDKTVKILQSVALFLEQVENKNDEACRDLGETYILIGELFQHAGEFEKSVQWLEKAIVVDDRYDVTYHSLANSYIQMGNTNQAVKCLEQEIRVAPGNYFAYYVLADIYEQLGEGRKFERTLEMLLERDTNNIRALHKLILHYEAQDPDLEVELLRRRLIGTKANLSKRELVIWTYHMCKEGQYAEALRYLTLRLDEKPELRIIYLLRSFLYGKLSQSRKKTSELKVFVKECTTHQDQLETGLLEFQSVFGETDARFFVRKLTLEAKTA
jgi:tetratricopeptide (TPR) repeat protein